MGPRSKAEKPKLHKEEADWHVGLMSRPPSQKEKKTYLNAVGQKLVERRGKKKYYSREEVDEAITNALVTIDWACLAYCVFLDEATFDAIHAGIDVVCDYHEMRRDALAALTEESGFLEMDLDLSWLEWPDIDLGSVFDWFDVS